MKNLCETIIWSACFLELSEDDVVDPDSAVKALEDMAYSLQQATDDEKKAFVEACESVSASLEQENQPEYSKTIEFIRDLPTSMGLE
jgi:hypothetical protein